MTLLPHIEDAFRAARRESERYSTDTDDRPTRAEAEEDASLGRTPLSCPACGQTEDGCLPPGCCLVCTEQAARVGAEWRHLWREWFERGTS